MADPSIPAPPVTPTQPLVQIDPAQLDLLEQRGHVSPAAAAMARAQMGLLDARLRLNPQHGFSQMLGNGGLPGVPVPAGQSPTPAGAPPPTAGAGPQAPKLTPEQKKMADLWMQMAGNLVWADPRKVPVGTHTDIPAANLPKKMQALLQQMYPERYKGGEVPLGWAGQMGSMPPDQQAMMAKLMWMGEQERQSQMLADPKMRQQVQQAGAPVPQMPPQPGGM